MLSRSPESAEPLYRLLDDLDARQNDVLAQLDELNQRVEHILADYTKAPQPELSVVPKAA